jgi:hypothetical protein
LYERTVILAPIEASMQASGGMFAEDSCAIRFCRASWGVLTYQNNHRCHCGKYGTRTRSNEGNKPIGQIVWYCQEHAGLPDPGHRKTVVTVSPDKTTA